MDRKPNGQFAKGAHWRPRKPYWESEWLSAEYVEKGRSAHEIASDFGVTENAIYHWLDKHGIPRRLVSEARKIKHWGAEGEANPMYRMCGPLSPAYIDGRTPERQRVYSRCEWRRAHAAVWARDRGVCAHCGKRDANRRRMHVHHVKPFDQYPDLRCDVNNLVLLCSKCHSAVHRQMRQGVMPSVRTYPDRGLPRATTDAAK